MADARTASGTGGDSVERIRVMIVDDHAMVRSGLSAFLLASEDLELAAEASSGEEAVRLCGEAQVDVVLMDLVMPGMDGATATRTIREACPRVQVIALTSFPEEDLVKSALEAGAIGYLLKNVTSAELADAIRAAHAGRPTLAPEATSALIHNATERAYARLGSHRAGARSARADGRRPLQLADRLEAVRERLDCEVPRELGAAQAGRSQPHRSRVLGDAGRARIERRRSRSIRSLRFLGDHCASGGTT